MGRAAMSRRQGADPRDRPTGTADPPIGWPAARRIEFRPHLGLRASQAASANSLAGAPCLNPRITPESGRRSYARAESPFACRTRRIRIVK